ncbi:MAG: dicarboxylate/amino acid:cation symporter [Bacteroidota bacterium]|nr:dicarboxylate/amino acid:cation symporter [Bacteroidota bacterium]MDX5426977.1 dicarboxylate/amino acid:cation symporter [Bacteroidota bacterium]MDX5448754.1 dicarboxylate/amino acid:cation symporter [Bacteroidota bacterium]MDX5504965.1 dicarboxylate/amino acid:cation symporter [Bacteroidota bacterium]
MGKNKKKLPLHLQIIIGLALGIVWAFIASFLGLSDFTMNWIAPWGTIFINLLKLIAIPLVLFSIISGITGLSDVTTLGRMGVKTLGLYLVTTIMAVSIGLILVNTLKPGKYISEEQGVINRISYELWATRNNVPMLDNRDYLHKEAYAGYLSAAEAKLAQDDANPEVTSKVNSAKSAEEQGPLQFIVDMVPSNIFLAFNDSLMLQVIFFAIFFGLTIVTIPREKTMAVVGFVDGANEVFIKMVDIVMAGAPYFVFALLAGKLSELAGDDPSRVLEIFKVLGYYVIVVVLGLALMIFLIYPTIVSAIIAKKNNISFGKAYRYFNRGIRPAQLLAFSTSSSAATLPVTMECVHDNLKVEEEVSSFVLPIGATVNMDGTSLYQAVAVIFLAQFHLVDLTVGQQVTIILTATLASIGSAAVPSAGLIMLIIVLESVGLNPAWIAIIFPVDRILDMCRTVVNVTGDATVSTVVAQSEGKLKYHDVPNV